MGTPTGSGVRRGRLVAAAAALVAVLVVVALALGVGGVSSLTTPSDRSQQDSADDGGPRRAAPLPGKVLDTIGVVSYNARRTLPFAKAKRDWNRLNSRPGVDVIGWQEATNPDFRDLSTRYRARGWETWVASGRPISPAFSWRRATFTLLDVTVRRMHRGADSSRTDAPFPSRWVVQAELRHRPTGRTVTLLNTHVNQTIETGQRFEDNLNARRAKLHFRTLARLWNAVPGDVVVGTGDYNFDYADDSAARPAGGINRRFEDKALSSYAALGLDGLVPTRNTRWIDYVWLSSDSVKGPGGLGRSGSAQFASHRSLAGFASDHRPMLARIRLYR